MSENIASISHNDTTQSAQSEAKQITHRDDSRLNVIRELVSKGQTIREIGAQLGISHTCVWRFCKQHAIRLQSHRAHFYRISSEAIIARRDAGDSKAEAAAHFGINTRALGRLIRHYGLLGRWPGTDRALLKCKLTPENSKRGRLVAIQLKKLSYDERDRYHALKAKGLSTLQAFARIGRDRKSQQGAPSHTSVPLPAGAQCQTKPAGKQTIPVGSSSTKPGE